jgi:hypothetical protein
MVLVLEVPCTSDLISDTTAVVENHGYIVRE